MISKEKLQNNATLATRNNLEKGPLHNKTEVTQPFKVETLNGDSTIKWREAASSTIDPIPHFSTCNFYVFDVNLIVYSTVYI